MRVQRMNKLAIFTEGQTEQIFAEWLVLSLGDDARVGIRVERVHGGRRGQARRITEISGTSEVAGHEFFVLIVDCGQDERVKSDILDRYDRLISAGYKHIIGIRDLFPHSRDDVGRIRDGFVFKLPVEPVKPALILAIMEAEAWFLAEYSHFPRIQANLTIDRIQRELGFDPVNDDMQLRHRPSKDLENIYFLETVNYHKTRADVECTVDCLDLAIIQHQIATKIHDLGDLVKQLRTFFNAR